MGWIRHHAIVVTSCCNQHINAAHAKAVEIFGKLLIENNVSTIVGPTVNGTYTFLIAPDGSKEGWDTSDAADAARTQWIEWGKTQSYIWIGLRFNMVTITEMQECSAIVTAGRR